MCHILASALQERGFVTDHAFNGRAASDRLLKRKEKPDLILLDLVKNVVDQAEAVLR